MKILFYFTLFSVLFASCGCLDDEHCFCEYQNNTGDSLFVVADYPDGIEDTSLNKYSWGEGYSGRILPNQNIKYSVSVHTSRASIEGGLENSKLKKVSFYFFKYRDYSLSEYHLVYTLIQQGKLLKRKDYTLEDLKANNWVITYP